MPGALAVRHLPHPYVICRTRARIARLRPCAADPASSCRDRVDRHRRPRPWCPRAPRSCSRPACAACRSGSSRRSRWSPSSRWRSGRCCRSSARSSARSSSTAGSTRRSSWATCWASCVAGGALDRVPLWRPFADRAGAVRGRAARSAGWRRRCGILVAARFVQGLGGGAVGPDGLRRDRPDAARAAPAADVRAAVDGVGRARRDRAVDRGDRRRVHDVAAGVPGPAAAARRRRRARGHGAPPDPGRGAAGRARGRRTRRPARCPTRCWRRPAPGSWSPRSPPQRARARRSAARSSASPCCCRRSGALTPPGTLALAAGVPAAILLRGVMTFAFFSGDAYIPLLLQTWRGTPATLTGLVFTGTTIAWTVATWLQARRIDVWGPHAVRRPGLRAASRSGALITIPAVLPGFPAGAHDLHLAAAGPRDGLHVLRGDAGRAARRRPGRDGRRVVGAPAVGHPGHGAGRRASPGAITAFGTRAGGDALGWALAAVFAMSSIAAGLGAARVALESGCPGVPRSTLGAAVD